MRDARPTRSGGRCHTHGPWVLDRGASMKPAWGVLTPGTASLGPAAAPFPVVPTLSEAPLAARVMAGGPLGPTTTSRTGVPLVLRKGVGSGVEAGRGMSSSSARGRWGRGGGQGRSDNNNVPNTNCVGMLPRAFKG